MGDLRIGLVIEGDAKSATRAFRTVTGDLNKVDGPAGRSAGVLGSAAKALGAVTKVGAVAGATVGILGTAFAATVGRAAEFDLAMAEVSTLVDTSQVSMADLSDEALDLATRFGSSPVDQARAPYQTISAGAEAGAETRPS